MAETVEDDECPEDVPFLKSGSGIGVKLEIVSSTEMLVPPDLARDQIEHYRRQAEAILNHVTAEAEAWAESGVGKARQMPLLTGPFQPLLARIDPSPPRLSKGIVPVRQPAFLATESGTALSPV